VRIGSQRKAAGGALTKGRSVCPSPVTLDDVPPQPRPFPVTAAALHPPVPADQAAGLHGLLEDPEPPGPAPQGDVPAPRPPAAREVRAADPAGGRARPAPGAGHDQHPPRLGGAAARTGLHAPGPPSGSGDPLDRRAHAWNIFSARARRCACLALSPAQGHAGESMRPYHPVCCRGWSVPIAVSVVRLEASRPNRPAWGPR